MIKHVEKLLKMPRPEIIGYLEKLSVDDVADILHDMAATVAKDVAKWKRGRFVKTGRRVRRYTLILDRVHRVFRQKSVEELNNNEFLM